MGWARAWTAEQGSKEGEPEKWEGGPCGVAGSLSLPLRSAPTPSPEPAVGIWELEQVGACVKHPRRGTHVSTRDPRPHSPLLLVPRMEETTPQQGPQPC